MKCLLVIVALIPFVLSGSVDETEYHFGPEGLTKYLLNRFPTGNFQVGAPWENAPKRDSHVTLCRQIFGDHSVHCVEGKSDNVDITFKGSRNVGAHVIAGNKSIDVASKGDANGHVVFATKRSNNHEFVGVFFNLTGLGTIEKPHELKVNKTVSGGAGISIRGGHKMQMGEEMTNFFNDDEIDANNVLRIVAGSKVIKTTTVGNYTRTVAKFGRARASIFRVRKSNDNACAHIKIDGKVIVKVTTKYGSKTKSIVAVSKSRNTIVVRKGH